MFIGSSSVFICGIRCLKPHDMPAHVTKSLWLAVGLALVLGNAARAESAARPAQIGAGFSYESLTGGFAPWREFSLDGNKVYGERKVAYATLRQTQRFSLTDNEAMIGGYYPLSDRWTANAEGSVSPSHNVLPRLTATAQLYRTLSNGWGTQFGLSHREYTAATVNLANATLERYWGKYRAAYTLWLSQLGGADIVSSHALAANRYYDERSAIGLILAIGREAESLGTGRILLVNVRSVNLLGSHWFEPDWAIVYALGVTEQRPLYTRSKVQVGFRHQF